MLPLADDKQALDEELVRNTLALYNALPSKTLRMYAEIYARGLVDGAIFAEIADPPPPDQP